ncbi:MAG: acetoacetate decarboxylase family protein [Dehalococcoidia bacterium]
MLSGTANIDQLAARAVTMASFDTEPFNTDNLDVLYAVYEIAHEGRDALLPAGLHPTEPGHATFVFYRAHESAWGPFQMALARIGCRSGARPRGFVLQSYCDNPEVGRQFRERFGFRCDPAEISFIMRYSGGTASVKVDGRTIFDMILRDPLTLTGADIQYINSITLAHTPMGLRLVQVEPEYTVHRAERAKPVLQSFDSEAWGSPLLKPVHPVSASLCKVDFTWPTLRFVQKPDIWAFDGTEQIKRPQPA